MRLCQALEVCYLVPLFRAGANGSGLIQWISYMRTYASDIAACFPNLMSIQGSVTE
jgi:hypothetical protein